MSRRSFKCPAFSSCKGFFQFDLNCWALMASLASLFAFVFLIISYVAKSFGKWSHLMFLNVQVRVWEPKRCTEIRGNKTNAADIFQCSFVCIKVFVFDHDHLLFWFIFDENPFLRLSVASHGNLGFGWGHSSFLGNWASETLSEGIPVQLFDSPQCRECQIGPKWTQKSTLLS